MSVEAKQCPHCGAALSKWEPPVDSSWGGTQLVCFSNECPYYLRGWEWMKEQYQQRASYRYRYDLQTGEEGPLPVWSEQALREAIADNEGEA